MNLYPLKFKPLRREKIWGSESWELSGLTDFVSEVENGFLAGNSLDELIEVYMGELVGDGVYEMYGNYFPLLFKFIKADDKLSIQVHPDDETAFERHRSFGKTEMWYIVDALPDSQLIAGFSRDCNQQTFLQAVEHGNAESLLQHVNVKRGDVLLIAPGRVHSIGKGILLAEIQQASDITYRIYDYNRTDDKGNRRELHISEALDVIDYRAFENPLTDYSIKPDSVANLAGNEYFTTNLIEFDRLIVRDYTALDSFVVYMCVDGGLSVNTDGGECLLSKGETVLIPASLNEVQLMPQSKSARLLEIYIDNIDGEDKKQTE